MMAIASWDGLFARRSSGVATSKRRDGHHRECKGLVMMAIDQGPEWLAVRVGDPQDGVALNQLLFATAAVLQRGLGEAIEVA